MEHNIYTIVKFRVAMTCTCTHKGLTIHYKEYKLTVEGISDPLLCLCFCHHPPPTTSLHPYCSPPYIRCPISKNCITK